MLVDNLNYWAVVSRHVVKNRLIIRKGKPKLHHLGYYIKQEPITIQNVLQYHLTIKLFKSPSNTVILDWSKIHLFEVDFSDSFL